MKSPIGSWVVSSIRSMSSSSKKIMRRMVNTASSAVRTSVTSWYIWSGISQSFWKMRPLATFRAPSDPPSAPCQVNVCSHSPGAGTSSVGPLTIRRLTGPAVDNNRLARGHLQGVLARDAQVDAGVEPDLGRAGDVLLAAVAEPDDEELGRVGDEVLHRAERLPPPPHPLRADDDFHAAVHGDHQGALALFDDVVKHATVPDAAGGVEAGVSRVRADDLPDDVRNGFALVVILCEAPHPALEFGHRLAERAAEAR